MSQVQIFTIILRSGQAPLLQQKADVKPNTLVRSVREDRAGRADVWIGMAIQYARAVCVCVLVVDVTMLPLS